MEYVKSCGFVVYKKINGSNYYLLIKSFNGDIGFPKGHIEAGESEIETALREVKEETNIDVLPIKNFREQIEYKLKYKPGFIKQSIYFLGESINDDIIPQISEVEEAKFLSFKDAYKLLTFNQTKEILKKAEEFLLNLK